MAHVLLDSTESLSSYLIFVYFWTDIFATGNLSLELVYSQLEQFGQGGGGGWG